MNNITLHYLVQIILLSVCSIFIHGCNEQSKPTVTKVVQKELFEKFFDLSTLNDSLFTTKIHSGAYSIGSLDHFSLTNQWSIYADTSEVAYSSYISHNSKRIYRIIYYRVVQYDSYETTTSDCSLLVCYPAKSVTIKADRTKCFYILATKESHGNMYTPYLIRSNVPKRALTNILKPRAYHYTLDISNIELDYSYSMIEKQLFFRNIKIGGQPFEKYLPRVIVCSF